MSPQKVTLKDFTTFRMGGEAELFTLSSRKEVEIFFSAQSNYTLIGGGSNILVADSVFQPFVKIIANKTLVETCDSESVYIRSEAGKNWDEFVAETVHAGLSGLELLSYIPGTVGAAPVQNVGAYGAEIKDTLLEVTVYDTKEKKWKILRNADCAFSYRKSVFQEHKEYIIFDTLWKLSKTLRSAPTYPSLKSYVTEHNIPVSLSSLRDAVIAVRRSKLPEIADTPSVGSFFKNPIVKEDVAKALKEKWEKLPTFEASPGYSKLVAGYLVEEACKDLGEYKGLSLYEKNKLVIVNRGKSATLTDVLDYAEMIQKRVQGMFGVELIREPEIIR